MNKTSAAATSLAVGMIAGCGALVTPDYPDRLVGADGQLPVLEEIEDIANIPEVDLDDDGRRALLRELGIEDEELIDALLDL